MSGSTLMTGQSVTVDGRGPSKPVVVAKVVKPVGLNGTVKAEALSDAPGRFSEGAEFWVLTTPPHRVTVDAVQVTPDGRLSLRFEGYSSVEAVGAWRGCFLAVDESERAQLPDDVFYHDELRGMSVATEAGTAVGVIREVWSNGPYDLLALDDRGTERLLPMIREFVVRIDRVRRHVIVRPPAGWMDDVAV